MTIFSLPDSPGRRLPLVAEKRPCRSACSGRDEVIRAASAIEGNVARVMQWYTDDPIESLGGRTACDLVASGEAGTVLHFLMAILVREARLALVH